MSAGATVLECLADIEKPNIRLEDAHWLSMNGTLFVEGENQKEKTVYCRFTYFRENTSEFVAAGRYAIKAMVRFMRMNLYFLIISTRASMQQVMGTHEHAENTLFQLRGDIFSVSCFQHSI